MAGNTSPNGEWKRRESFGSAMVQIAVVAVVLAGVVGIVYQRGANKKALGDLMREARAEAVRGNVSDLKKALRLTDQALGKDGAAGDPNAFAAALETDLWLLHHEPGAEAKAKAALEKAKKADTQTEERYGVEAQLLLASGDAAGAVAFVDDLRKKGGSGARIYLALAQALKAQGNLTLARTGFTAAVDKAWRDGNYACAFGEAALEEGTPGALDTFTKVVNQSPELIRGRLGLALARLQRHERLTEIEPLLAEVLNRDAELSRVQKARALAITAGLQLARQQLDQAGSSADQALVLNADDQWALFFKAAALAGKKDPAASAAFDAVIAKAPSAPTFYFEGAGHLLRAGQGDAAMALLGKYEAFFKNVKNPTADGKEVAYLERDDRYWLARGDLLRDSGKLDEALAAYDRAIAAKNINLARATLAKASVLVTKREFDRAGELLQDITPPDGSGQLPEAYLAMGEVLFAKKAWGPGCQNYAYALARLKATQASKERLSEVFLDVEKRLKAAAQGELAKLWLVEAKPLIQ